MYRTVASLALLSVACIPPEGAVDATDTAALPGKPGGEGGAGGHIAFHAARHVDSTTPFRQSGGLGGMGTPPGAAGATGSLSLHGDWWTPFAVDPHPDAIVSALLIDGGGVHFEVGPLDEEGLDLLLVGHGVEVVVDPGGHEGLRIRELVVQEGGRLRFAEIDEPSVCQGTLCFAAGAIDDVDEYPRTTPHDIALHTDVFALHGTLDQRGVDGIRGAPDAHIEGADVTVHTAQWDFGDAGYIDVTGGDGVNGR